MNDMNITSAQYVSHPIEDRNMSIKAVIDGVEIYVPLNAPGNRHYDEIMRQQSEGLLTIEDAE